MLNIKVPTAVLSMGLTPNALKVYCCLLACQDKKKIAVVRMGKIAERCGIARATVATSVQLLEAAGLILRSNQYKADGTYRSNKYRIAPLCGRWCSVPFNALKLPSSVFAVYTALRSFAGKGGRCFPSLSLLSNMLNLCRNTVIAAIKQLQLQGLLRKAKQWAGKHNLYILCSEKQRTKKERMAKQPSVLANEKVSGYRKAYKTILMGICKKVNGRISLFAKIFVCWVVHFLYNKPIPTCNATKKRRNLSLKHLLRGKLGYDYKEGKEMSCAGRS